MFNLNSYKDYIKSKREVKNFKRKMYKRKTLLMPKVENDFQDKILSLYDIEKFNNKKRNRETQSEITSVSRKIENENKLMAFITTTLNPKMNLTNQKFNSYKTKHLLNDTDTIDKILKEQYETFKNFNNKLVRYNYNKNGINHTLKTDFLRVLELTKKNNIHQHQITLTNTHEEMIEYIKRIILKRQNEAVGRIEIRLDENLLQEIIKRGIKVRIKNKYINLTFQPIKQKHDKFKRTFYKLKETELSRGNYIYLKPIENLEKRTETPLKDNKEHITKYLFKYLLKRSNEESFENMLFHSLDMRQKHYSHNFFTEKISKSDLFKISSKLYRVIKHNNTISYFKKNNIDKNSMIFETRNLLNKNIIEYDAELKLVLFNNQETQEQEELFELNEYNKETYKGKWGELELLEEKLFVNDTLTIDEELKLKRLQLKKQYEEMFLTYKLEDKKRELRISKKLMTQYKNVKKKFPLTTYNDMTKIQRGFSKIIEYFEYEKELKKDWEMNFIFHIFQEYKPAQGIFLLSYKNYKNNILTIKQHEKELKLQENIIQRDLKEKYISNIIENKSYKIEIIEDF